MTHYPRRRIADQVSDLRQLRGRLSELVILSHRLAAQAADMPEAIRLELFAAIAAADRADEIAKARISELYNTPTPRAVNDDREKAA